MYADDTTPYVIAPAYDMMVFTLNRSLPDCKPGAQEITLHSIPARSQGVEMDN